MLSCPAWGSGALPYKLKPKKHACQASYQGWLAPIKGFIAADYILHMVDTGGGRCGSKTFSLLGHYRSYEL